MTALKLKYASKVHKKSFCRRRGVMEGTPPSPILLFFSI